MRTLALTLLLLPLFVHAQDVRVNDTFQNEVLTKALRQLKRKYKINIAYAKSRTDGYRVNTSWQNAPLSEVMDDLLSETNLTFEIFNERNVLIRQMPEPQPVQNLNASLNGIILDDETGSALPYATLYDASTGKAYSTNEEGRFAIPSISQEGTLKVFYIGYKEYEQPVNRLSSYSGLIIRIQPDINLLSEVVIDEWGEVFAIDRENQSLEVNNRISKYLPNVGEDDVFGPLRNLPGIAGNKEFQNGITYRGSSPGQNNILLDGFKIYHPDHFFGLFSTVDAESVKKTTFLKTGFNAKYGGVSSSILSLHGQTANLFEAQVSGKATPLSFSGKAEIPVIKGKSSVFLSARRSYIRNFYTPQFKRMFSSVSGIDEDLISDQSVRIDDPVNTINPDYEFSDVFIKWKNIVSSRHVANISYYTSNDDLAFERRRESALVNGPSTPYVETAHTNWRNEGFAINLSSQWNPYFFSTLKVSSSNYRSAFENENEIGLQVHRERNFANDFTIEQQNEFTLANFGVFTAGLNYNFFRADYTKRSNDYWFVNGTPPSGNVLTTYMDMDQTITERVSLNYGVRMGYFDRMDKVYFEPRFRLGYQFSSKLSFNAAWGIYRQFIHQVSTNNVLSGNRSFWLITDGIDFPITRSEHLNASLNYTSNSLSISLDVFRIANAGIIEYAFQSADVRISNPTIANSFFSGESTVTGAEFQIQKVLPNYEVLASYGYNLAEFTFPGINEGQSYPGDHFPRNEVKVFQKLTFGHWFISGNFYYGDGLRYTAPDQLTMASPSSSTITYASVDNSDINNKTLPPVIRFNLGIGHERNLGSLRTGFSVSLINAFNRDNVVDRTLTSTHMGNVNDQIPYEFQDQRSIPRMLTFQLSIGY